MDASRRPARHVRISLWALAVLPGCVAVDNDRHRIGQGVPVEAVSLSGTGGGAPVLPADGPSLTGVDRANWSPTAFLVPIDGTYHWPTYRLGNPIPHVTDRQRGLAPTPRNALDLDPSNGQQAGEAFAEPVVAAAEILAMAPWMVVRWPWVAERSPGEWPYERSRREDPGAGAGEEGAVR